MPNLDWVRAEIAERRHRARLYGDHLSQADLDAWLESLESELDTDGLHDECVSQDYVDQNYVTVEEHEEKVEILEGRIDDLEGQLSDAIADINVYKKRIEKGVVHASLADQFIFTPEDARAKFKLVEGGVA